MSLTLASGAFAVEQNSLRLITTRMFEFNDSVRKFKIHALDENLFKASQQLMHGHTPGTWRSQHLTMGTLYSGGQKINIKLLTILTNTSGSLYYKHP